MAGGPGYDVLGILALLRPVSLYGHFRTLNERLVSFSSERLYWLLNSLGFCSGEARVSGKRDSPTTTGIRSLTN